MTWLALDADWLVVAGLLTVYAGLVLFAIGFLCLILSTSLKSAERRPTRREIWVAGAALGANFPVAAAYMTFAYALLSANFVTVNNAAKAALSEVTFIDSTGKAHAMPDVPNNAIHSDCLDFSGEGEVVYTMRLGGQQRAGILIYYLATPLGSQATVQVSETGILSANQQTGRLAVAAFLRHCLL